MLRTARHLALVLPLALAPAAAWAAPPPKTMARLTYQRGPGAEACEKEDGLRFEVERRAGYNPFTLDAPARLVVNITRKGRQLIGTIQFYDDTGAPGWSKTLPVRANDCGTLLAAMGAEIEYEFDSSSPSPEPTPEPSPPVAAPTVVAPPMVAPPVAPPPVALPSVVPPPPPHPATRRNNPSEPTNSLVHRFGLGATFALGVAPRYAVGLYADAGIYWPLTPFHVDGVSLSLGGRWDPPAGGYLPKGPESARVSTSRLLATLAPCVHGWVVYGCAVGQLGGLWARSEDVTIPAQGLFVYSAVGGRFGIDFPFTHHLGFRFSAELLRTLTSMVLPLDEHLGWKAPPTSGGFEAGLLLFF